MRIRIMMLCTSVLLFAVLTMSPTSRAFGETPLQTENVILITVDGLRIQELFGGLDPIIIEDDEKSGVENIERLRERYWRETPEGRREALFPFFWKTLAPQGVILGNQEKNSHISIRNPYLFSYPGYAEILTGQFQRTIRSNAPIRIRRPTILDHVQTELELGYTDVAAFASWEVFDAIVSHREDAFVVNAGYRDMNPNILTPGMEIFNTLQHRMLTPWDSVRFDSITFGLAIEYLKEYKPRFLYIALGETDDWAHNRRYDRVIHAAALFDECMQALWNQLQSMDEYRDKTTLVISTDHGRGVTPDDWMHHSATYPTSRDIWIAVFGPDTPNRGELESTPEFYQSHIAATVLKFFGLDYAEFNPDADPPIPMAFIEASE